MSITSRLSALVRSVARSPETRRAARRLADQASRAISRRAGGEAPTRSRPGTGAGASGRPTPRTSERASGREHRGTAADGAIGAGALADRGSAPPLSLDYAPVDDDLADPGEIVWAWVAFEEDISQGKDRPVLVLAREDAAVGGSDGGGTVAVALMLTSHDRGSGTHVDEHGATWVDVGSGAWDSRRRPSEVRVDRLLRLPLSSVRREGARLDRDRFEDVAREARRVHGWR